MSLCQAFAHCTIFLAAASRRSLGRVSVPVWLTILSDQLPVIGLVGRYPTNYLIGCKPLLKRPKALILSLAVKDHMRYQPRFLRVVPHLRVGYLHITHPFAAIFLLREKPLDLHA